MLYLRRIPDNQPHFSQLALCIASAFEHRPEALAPLYVVTYTHGRMGHHDST